MAFMRGKFYVWGDGKNVNIIHGRDVTEESIKADLDGFLKLAGITEDELTDTQRRLFSNRAPDPEELRTGVVNPMQVFLPEEVFWALVVRAYDRLTPEEAEKYRGSTRWEQHREGDDDGGP